MEEAQEQRNVSLNASEMKLAEFERSVYRVTLQEEYTKDDLLNPSFWAHVAQSFRPTDLVEVYRVDGKVFAQLVVMSCDKTWAKMAILQYVDLAKAEKSSLDGMESEYMVKLRGPKRWSVIRRADNQILQENLFSESDAKNWLEVYINQKAA